MLPGADVGLCCHLCSRVLVAWCGDGVRVVVCTTRTPVDCGCLAGQLVAAGCLIPLAHSCRIVEQLCLVSCLAPRASSDRRARCRLEDQTLESLVDLFHVVS